MNSIKKKICAGIVITVFVFNALSGIASLVINWNTNPHHVRAIITFSVLAVVAAVIAYFIARGIANKIADPLIKCVGRLQTIADGDIHSPMPEVNTNDETKIIRDTGAKIVDRLSGMVSDQHRVLSAMAKGNLNVEPQKDHYVGDLEDIYTSMETIIGDMSTVFTDMKVVADQVAAGADQVSAGAQELSQGATEQAASVEELAATIHNLSQQIGETKDHAENVDSLTYVTCGALGSSNTKMRDLIDAMNEIDATSEDIEKIIKTIEDIAFQTNILALNAAVEAARAGEAGKGFAVVADEVRNLAAKSAEASKDTEGLIEKSRTAVNKGNVIAQEAFDLLDGTVGQSDKVVESIHGILGAVIAQNSAIQQINVGVDQISSVVQTNSATSEESAASSEELSAQAERLDDLIAGFKINHGKVKN